jgi:hypothetical protein
MLELAITELQDIEKSVARKTLSELKIHLAIRSCLKQLRTLSVACPPPRELGYRSPPRLILVVEIRKRWPRRAGPIHTSKSRRRSMLKASAKRFRASLVFLLSWHWDLRTRIT